MDKRQVATSTLAELGTKRPELLEEVLLACDSPRQYPILFRKLARDRESFASHMRRILGQDDSGANRGGPGWQRRANAAMALALLGDWSALWSCLGDNPDPSLRTCLIHRMPDYGLNAEGLAAGLTASQAPSIRQAILLALGGYRSEMITATARVKILEYCRRMYLTDPDAGVHAGSEWLLRAWEQAADLQAVRDRLPVRTPVGNWFVTGKGHTMVVFSHAVSFAMGSPDPELSRDSVETRHERLIDRGFAIGTHEVTVPQFRRFRPEFAHAEEIARDPDCPANMVSFYDAAAYCRWLTSEEGMFEDQQCYPAEIGPAMKLPDNFLFSDRVSAANRGGMGIRCPSGIHDKPVPW